MQPFAVLHPVADDLVNADIGVLDGLFDSFVEILAIFGMYAAVPVPGFL